MNIVKHVLNSSGSFAKGVGSSTFDLAKDIGSGTADIAKRIGLKRALIGIAIAGVAVGGAVVLVRFLRARGEEGDETELADGVTRRKPKHKKNKYAPTSVQH